jgi:formylglycine-generating enzyme required for sulfatase activity
VNLTQANKFGLKGMHEQIWEWVEDFSQVMMPSDSRDTSAKASFFCAGAALKVKDPKRYAAFLRFAFRSGLSGRYTSKNLGFRCVRDKKGSGS